MPSDHPDEPLTPGAAHAPQGFVGYARDAVMQFIGHATPALLAAGLGPDAVRLDGIPGRDMHAVCYVFDRDFADWPARKQGLKDAPAEFAMQAAYAEAKRGPALGKISHVERFVRIFGIDAPKTDNIVQRYAASRQFALNIR